MSTWIDWKDASQMDLMKSIDTVTAENAADVVDWAVTPQTPDLMKSLVMADAYNRAPADFLEKAILTTDQRKDTDKMHYLLDKDGKRMFPTPDAKHARLAYDMADRAKDARHISAEEADEVKRKAKERMKELGEPMGEDK